MKKSEMIDEILRISMQRYPMEFTSTLIAARKEILNRRPKSEITKIHHFETEVIKKPTPFSKRKKDDIDTTRRVDNGNLEPETLVVKIDDVGSSSGGTNRKVRTRSVRRRS